MKFNKKSRKILVGLIFFIAVLSQFLPTLSNSYTNSDSPAHLANGLLVTLDKPIQYPVEVFHYKFYSKFRVSGLASVSVDAHLPLPPTYLFLLYPFFKIMSPMAALSILYLFMALFSGLSTIVIYLWVKDATDNHSAGLISGFLFAIMPIGYLYFAGGDFPQIMGQFFVLLTIFCIYKFYDKILNLKVFLGLTVLIFISLLIHLGSTIGLLTILFFIFLYYLYNLFRHHIKDNFIKYFFVNKEGKKIIFFGLSVLIALIVAYFSYYHSFLNLFLEASSKSTTGTFLIPQLNQIYQLWRGYWFFILFIPSGWFLLKENKKFRAYVYLWFLVALIYFILNIEIRFVYLIYPVIAIVSGITLNKFFDDKKCRKYIFYFLIIMFFITLLATAKWWTHFPLYGNNGYIPKIENVIKAFRP